MQMTQQEFLKTYKQIEENLILVLRKGILEHNREVFPDWGTLMFFIDADKPLEVHFQVKTEDDPDITLAGYVPLDLLFATRDDILDAETYSAPLGDDYDDD